MTDIVADAEPRRWTSLTSPRWADPEQQAIDCEVEIAGIGVVPFTATASDIEPIGREIHAALLAGAAGPIAAWVPPSAPVPGSVTAFQARAALLAAGLLDEVEAAVAAADRLTQTAWEYAQAFERTSPTIAALAAALGLTDAQLDDLFRAAAKISA